MSAPRYLTLRVQYDGQPNEGRALAWIAPELNGAGLKLIRDELSAPTPCRTWAGLVGQRQLDRLARAWHLHAELADSGSKLAQGPDTHTYTLDGMNWEVNGQSPIVCVTLQIDRSGTGD